MAGSTFGTIFKVMTWGESHGKGIGVVIDGCPAGIPLSEEDIQPFLNRRKPGQNGNTDFSAGLESGSAFTGLQHDRTAVSPGTCGLHL